MKIEITRQSGIYTLTSEQILPVGLAEAWQFFTIPKNLDAITPSDMNFAITNNPGESTYAGQIITYKIGILPFIKNNWITEITHLVEEKFFVDEQRFGPYQMWHLEHHFEKINDDKTLMIDIVNYKLPFGMLGDMIAGRMIRKKLIKIFTFRYIIFEEKFKNKI